jgi:DNA-binding NtrC family response regulator
MDNLAQQRPVPSPQRRDAEVVRRLGLALLPALDAEPLSDATRFGSLVGGSRAMRATYALLERVAASDTTVLIEGETGTGKGRAAESIHRASPRGVGRFIVVDCGAMPATLLESELFGHEKGAFTGAEARRVGAFEEADGGTLFLDEIGELPLELQPKLLRAIEGREIRRVGSNRHFPVNLRVVAATNRDLRAEVDAGRFRGDLYYRLAVVKVRLPALHERPEDLPALVDELLRQLGAPAGAVPPCLVAEWMAQPWPGNVRELRNAVEARVVLSARAAAPRPSPPAPAPLSSSEIVQFSDARKQALEGFERAYLEELMRRFPGRVAQAAQAAGLDRVYLYRLLRKQGVKI